MLTHMKLHTAKKDSTEICLTVPPEQAAQIYDVIHGMLTLAGHTVNRVNDEGERLFSTNEVFPEASPAMALRGFRAREEITQNELADRLAVKQTHVSEMESGKRTISVNMAKRLGKVFNVSHKAFL